MVVNGSPPGAYEALRRQHPAARWLFSADPLGFSAAVAHGLSAATLPWTVLLNSDCVLETDAICVLAGARAPDVFAVGARIDQRSADGRVEETGLVDWYADAGGVRLFHAPIGEGDLHETLCVSGGAGLFRTAELRRYVLASRCYDPFYFEDVEWGLRAWRDGFRCVVASRARVRHARRGTIARYYTDEEVRRTTERNRLLFELRMGLGEAGARAAMRKVCDLEYSTQRELSNLSIAAGVAATRLRYAGREPSRPPSLAPNTRPLHMGGSFSQRPRSRRPGVPKLLVVSPFCVFPPRHGAARRTAELLLRMKPHFDISLVVDEATLHDSRSFAGFDGLCEVRLVQRPKDPLHESGLGARIERHAHPHMASAVQEVLADADVVLIEHAELSPLVRGRGSQRWILALHDAVHDSDFEDARAAATFRRDIAAFDAVTLCSPEDAALIQHRAKAVVPNGAESASGYNPSSGTTILFVGPFRYSNNRTGIEAFITTAWDRIRESVRDARLVILGGDEALADAGAPAFQKPGIELLGHQEDMASHYAACALTINPTTSIRGSALKTVESLVHGRVCVATREAARGFAALQLPGLVLCEDMGALGACALELLTDTSRRHTLETPSPLLRDFSWDAVAQRQLAVLRGEPLAE